MLYGLVGVLILGSLLLAGYARGAVGGAVARYREVPARAGLSGREVAEYVLRAGGADGVGVERSAGGDLSDHYDPRARVLRLSQAVHDGRDLAAFGIAAHEAGHALQHRAGYWPMWVRGISVPVARLGGTLGVPLALLGLGLRSVPMMLFGLALFGGVALFQLVTLPVELDASRRAVRALKGSGLVETAEEEKAIRSVLSSAALTYVAAAVSGIAGLAQLGLRLFGRRV